MPALQETKPWTSAWTKIKIVLQRWVPPKPEETKALQPDLQDMSQKPITISFRLPDQQ